MSIRKPTIGEWTDAVISAANEYAAYNSQISKDHYNNEVARLVRCCIQRRLAQVNRKHGKAAK